MDDLSHLTQRQLSDLVFLRVIPKSEAEAEVKRRAESLIKPVDNDNPS